MLLFMENKRLNIEGDDFARFRTYSKLINLLLLF